jgi:hypothetical protein
MYFFTLFLEFARYVQPLYFTVLRSLVILLSHAWCDSIFQTKIKQGFSQQLPSFFVPSTNITNHTKK